MAREEAYEAAQPEAVGMPANENLTSVDQAFPTLRYTYRHGDGTAEILAISLLDGARRPVEIVESGEPVVVRARVRFHHDVDDPVCGLLIRDRHGIHVYGTNTELQRVDLGEVRSGEIIEAAFSFNCWLAPGTFSVTAAVHSLDGISFDWIDGVLFFHVVNSMPVEGIANLNAGVTTRRLIGTRTATPVS